jgi:hypothetical protein
MSMLLLPYILHANVTPLGMVDLKKRFKTPHPVFDSTFQAMEWSFTINNWTTNKQDEPDVTFAQAFDRFLFWVWNMCISYPHQEIYPIDKGMTSGFCHLKYNPNLVAMHCYLVYGVLYMATGQTFGDTGSPGNFNAIPDARQQVAMYLWQQCTIISQAAPYTPAIEMAPLPEPSVIDMFICANPDLQNQGVFDVDGSRLPPTHDHHVDDLMSAKIGDLLPCTIAASILSLYEVEGIQHGTPWTPFPVKKLMLCTPTNASSWDGLWILTDDCRATGLEMGTSGGTTFRVACSHQIYTERSCRTPWNPE